MNFFKKRTNIITIIIFLGFLTSFAIKASEVQKCPVAADALKKGDYQAAYHKSSAGCPTIKKLALWYQLKDGHGDFAQYEEFIRTAKNWPWQAQILKNAEFHLNDDIPYQRIKTWFQENQPKTFKGLVAYIKVHSQESPQAIRTAFSNMPLNKKDLALFIQRFGKVLTLEDYEHRLDRLFEKGEPDAARHLITYVPDDSLKKMVEARIKFMQKSPDSDASYTKLNQDEQSNPGVLADYLKYLATREDPKSYDLIQKYKDIIIQDPERFSKTLHRLARDAIPLQKPEHVLTCLDQVISEDIGMQADLQWLLGWTHLKMLDNPTQALKHFEGTYPLLKTGMSQSKFAYWIAKTYDALGQREKVLAWLNKAAAHPTFFYGQLATNNLNKKLKLNFNSLQPKAQARTKVENLEVARAVKILTELKKYRDIPAFLYISKHSLKTFEERVAFVQLIKRLSPRHTVESARVLDIQHKIPEGFPKLSRQLKTACAIDPHLTHAIIRKESCFDPHAMSGAGAMGLMQVRPETARKLSKTVKVNFKKDQDLLHKEHLNVTLGTAYFAQQMENFGQNPMLTLAAYNAGPGNARKWQKRFGDPNQDEIDIVDWIELIPFSETRNYVQRVWESYKTYETMGNH